jgi:DNA helicase-2/ATP-dependent DNA helicase PcrA
VKLSSVEDEDKWHTKILSFIKKLRKSGKLTDYNQIAFLFSSVKNERATSLARYLEEHGVNVYSPRSDMFFGRDEIRLAIGCLMLMFPAYVEGLEEESHDFLGPKHYSYYRGCVEAAEDLLAKPEFAGLSKWILRRGKIHANLKDNTDYAYSGLMYQMFEFEPFKGILDTEMSAGVVDLRPTRNMAILTQVVGKFEYLHRIDVFSAKYLEGNTERFFNLYLRLLHEGGISEYEDDAEYAPSGCVSFLTIHQSKGMEFPIVVVDSLGNVPRKRSTDLMKLVEEKYFKRPAFEPHDDTKFFDFWRLYYTAFSRAQDLLLLTCNETSGRSPCPSKYFAETYKELPNVDKPAFDITEFDFKEVKDVNLKDTFSFTSHITVYETCSLQYKFYRELEFAPIRVNAMMFGKLVHQTIEDIHRAALRKEERFINPDNIASWFDANYTSLTRTDRTYLAEKQRAAALNHVLRYAQRQAGQWGNIQEAEVSVSLVKPDYIIEGKVDLIKGEDGTVELVDFKSERKPDVHKEAESLEHYRRQLHIYAHLIEGRSGQKVSKMHLYYTGDESGAPTITYPYTKTAVDGTVAAFDETVHKILRKEYRLKAKSAKTCENCDFRFYCNNKK